MMAQLTAINGKNIPNVAYKPGVNFSTIISTNCVMAAITAIKRIKAR